MVDTQSLLLPGVVAVVVGLSVLYLIYRLFVSSGSKKPTGKNPKKVPPKKKVAQSTDVAKKQPTKKATKAASPPKEEKTEKPASKPAVSQEAENKDEPVEQPPKKNAGRRKRAKEVLSEEDISDFLPLIVSQDKTEKKDKPTTPKVTGKNKIAAAKEEPLADGWEIVGLKKKEWKDIKKKERDEEVEKLKKEEDEKKDKKPDEGKKDGKRQARKGGDRPERREGGREGGRVERGPKGNRPFGDRKNRKDQDKKEDKVPSSPQVSEKTKRREEIKINGILFSKYKEDDEEEEEDWDLLSEIIENGSSASDDIAPLRTAHLELRYYTLCKDTPSPSKRRTHASPVVENKARESWSTSAGELAKYNYTQGKDEADKEKDEGSSEVSSPRVWDLGEEQTAGLPDDKTSELIEAYIKALGHPFTSNLAPAKLSVKGRPQRFLIQTDVDSLRARLLKLLSSGVSLEPPVCRSQSEAAEFVEKLLGHLDSPFVCYTNESQSSDGTYSRGAKFWRKGFGDAGFFIVSGTKVVMIWFIGYD